MDEKIRVDKFLWAIRLYKTRSLATEACMGGKVKIHSINVKPSRGIAVGDEIEALLEDGLHKNIRVKAIVKNRLGAKLVPEYIDDLTPQEEYERVALLQKMRSEQREQGTGRPTKKERRKLEWMKLNINE